MAKKSAKKPVKKPAKKVAKSPAKKSAKKVEKKAVKKAAKKVVKKAIKQVIKKKIVKAPAKKAAPKKSVKKVVSAKPITKPIVAKATESKFKGHTTHLREGDKAPYFEGIDQNGNTISSYSMAGKTIVLFFYPKDDTPGCTAEACSLRDEYYFLGTNNYAVVGVSADTIESHLKFAEKHSLPFPLIADTNMNIIHAFDVWGTKQLAGRVYDGIVRTTFIVGADGIIKNIIKNVDTKEHAKQVLAL